MMISAAARNSAPISNSNPATARMTTMKYRALYTARVCVMTHTEQISAIAENM